MTEPVLDTMRSPEQPQEIKDISIPLEGLISDTGTMSAPITTTDLLLLPQNTPSVDVAPELRAPLPGEEQVFNEIEPDIVLEIVDDLTGYKAMFSGLNEDALMAWICILPLGTTKITTGVGPLWRAINTGLFTDPAKKILAVRVISAALKKDVIQNSVQTTRALKDLESLLYKKAVNIDTELIPAISDLADTMVHEGLALAINLKSGIKAISTRKSLMAFLNSIPFSDKLKSTYAIIKKPWAISAAYLGSTIFGLFIQEEAQQTWGFAARNLNQTDVDKMKEVLSHQQAANETWMQAFIPVYGPLRAFAQFFYASSANIESYKTLAALEGRKPVTGYKWTEAELPASVDSQVIEVIDGDTVVTYINKHNAHIRLQGINTPEKGKPGYTQAMKYLTGLIGGQNVTFAIDPKNPLDDKYNRPIATIYYNGADICLEMVKSGWAMIDYAFFQWVKNQAVYKAAEAAAKANKLGIWANWPLIPLSAVKAQYISGTLTEPAARTAMHNLVLDTEGQNNYITDWTKKMSVSQLTQKEEQQKIMATTTSTQAAPAQVAQPDRNTELASMSLSQLKLELSKSGVNPDNIPTTAQGCIELIKHLENDNPSDREIQLLSYTKKQLENTLVSSGIKKTDQPKSAADKINQIMTIETASSNVPVPTAETDEQKRARLNTYTLQHLENILRSTLKYKGPIPANVWGRTELIIKLDRAKKQAAAQVALSPAAVTAPTPVKTQGQLIAELSDIANAITGNREKAAKLEAEMTRLMRNEKQNAWKIKAKQAEIDANDIAYEDLLNRQDKAQKSLSALQPKLTLAPSAVITPQTPAPVLTPTPTPTPTPTVPTPPVSPTAGLQPPLEASAEAQAQALVDQGIDSTTLQNLINEQIDAYNQDHNDLHMQWAMIFARAIGLLQEKIYNTSDSPTLIISVMKKERAAALAAEAQAQAGNQ